MAFTLRLPKEIEYKLNQIAKKEGCPKSYLIKSILDLYFIAYDLQEKEDDAKLVELVQEIEQLELDIATDKTNGLRGYLKGFFNNQTTD